MTTRREFLLRIGAGLASMSSPVGRAFSTGEPESAPGGAGARDTRPGERAHGTAGGGAPRVADAVFVVLGDTHSAYERYPGIVGTVDRVVAENPGVPVAILINGDLFERGNVVALRGGGLVDLALVGALAARAPVVFNLGNHEGAFFDMAEVVRRLEDAGAAVVSNAIDARTGRPFAAPSAALELGGARVVVAGIATDDLATYRAGVRETVRVPNPPDYGAERLRALFGGAPLRVVLSHAGTVSDRLMLPHVPDGTLVVGGHDHLRYVHRRRRLLYLHTGWWGSRAAILGARLDEEGPEWTHAEAHVPGGEPGEGWTAYEPRPARRRPDGGPEAAAARREGPGPGAVLPLRDAALAELVRAEQAAHLGPDDLAVVARTRRWLPFREAVLLAAAAIRDAAGADVGLAANTTFGTGLPAGEVTRHRFDAYVRFDGELRRCETDGATLATILAAANQFEDTPFERRTGEYVVATPLGGIDPARRYTVATHDWVGRNAARYLGVALDFEPVPGPGLKAVIALRLARV